MFLNKNYVYIFNRSFSTNNILFKSQSGNFMKKFLKENKSTKKWHAGDGYSSAYMPSPSNLAKGAHDGKKSSNSKRIVVLNKVFMKHITDLMATGCSSSIFLGHGIEINRVMVTPDFKGVNVFWIAKGSENDDKIDEILTQNAGALRHELSQLRVMGIVPKINFVKDKEYAKLLDVDNRLAKADFGEDHVPIEPSYRFKSELSTNYPLLSNIDDESIDFDRNEAEDEIPPMQMDIFGLNHAEIMDKVKKAIKKSQASHRTQNISSNLPNTFNNDPIQFTNEKERKEAFQQFLRKRQILQAKAKKEKDKYNPEYEYIKEENIKYLDTISLLDELKENDDYIDEEDTNKV